MVGHNGLARFEPDDLLETQVNLWVSPGGSDGPTGCIMNFELPSSMRLPPGTMMLLLDCASLSCPLVKPDVSRNDEFINYSISNDEFWTAKLLWDDRIFIYMNVGGQDRFPDAFRVVSRVRDCI